jgi:hypothetical protein
MFPASRAFLLVSQLAPPPRSGRVVPRDRIELSTPAFSGLCSAN